MPVEPVINELLGSSGPAASGFPDPYPAYRTTNGTSAPDPHIIFGTRNAVLRCPGVIVPGCYHEQPIHMRVAKVITDQVTAAGNKLVTTFNHNAFEDGNGSWDMALTATIRSSTNPAKHWDVILHAHPLDPRDSVPTTWSVDSVLEGSLTQPHRANYDGKYFENRGVLYLLYSRRLTNRPARDGIVAQRMETPSRPAATKPVVLIKPAPGAGFNSERFFENKPRSAFKLIETGNIVKAGGEYLMAYSTGAFNENDYKVGIARSATFLPPKGHTYHKQITQDPANVWHNPTHHDVRYLLQSQTWRWPGFVGTQVLAPGVPTIVADAGHWYLIFAGYAPRPYTTTLPGIALDPSTREPMIAPLRLLRAGSVTVRYPRALRLRH